MGEKAVAKAKKRKEEEAELERENTKRVEERKAAKAALQASDDQVLRADQPAGSRGSAESSGAASGTEDTVLESHVGVLIKQDDASPAGVVAKLLLRKQSR